MHVVALLLMTFKWSWAWQHNAASAKNVRVHWFSSAMQSNPWPLFVLHLLRGNPQHLPSE
jgi:hypothetical protein